MWNWENFSSTKKDLEPYSRFIASWTNACHAVKKPVYFAQHFEDWLRDIGVPEDDIHNIMYMACNGKCELQDSARLFIKEHMLDSKKDSD